MKNCWNCTKLGFTPGDYAYSEYTPSMPITLYCTKDKWDFDPYKTSESEAREMFNMAETCKYFDPVEPKVGGGR